MKKSNSWIRQPASIKIGMVPRLRAMCSGIDFGQPATEITFTARNQALKSIAQQRRRPGKATTKRFQQQILPTLHLARAHSVVQRQRH